MQRVLGGFSSDGDAVLVAGPDAGWWLTYGSSMDRRLIGITMPPAAGTVAWFRRMSPGRRDFLSPDVQSVPGNCSLAVITVAGASRGGQPAAGWVPAAFIRSTARVITAALRPAGYLAVIIADVVPDGWPQQARHDGHCVRAPRIPGLLPHRHIIMAQAAGHHAAGRQHDGWADSRQREQPRRTPAWHLLIYVKPGQVIPFPHSRRGR